VRSARTRGPQTRTIRASTLTAVTLGLLLLQPAISYAQDRSEAGPEPVILVYAVDLPNLTSFVAGLLRGDERSVERVLLVNTTDSLSTSLLFPNVRVAIMFGQTPSAVLGLESVVLSYFREGGGAVGFHEFANAENGALGTEVFPLFGNVSRLGTFSKGYLVQRLVREDLLSINEDLPPTLVFKDPEIVLNLDRKVGRCSNITTSKGSYYVLYRETAYGAPYVVAYLADGCSVTFAGGDIDDSKRNKLKYFGNLFLDANFTTLFLNSVDWVRQHQTREKVQVGNMLKRLEDSPKADEALRIRASKLRQKRLAIQLTLRALLNALLLALAALAYFKLYRVKSDAAGEED